MEEHYPYVLPPLRYEYDELEPQLSAGRCAFTTTAALPRPWTG
jgi:hypothetical protein